MSDALSSGFIPMSRYRRWLVCALSGGLIVGHAFDVATRGERWPISSYPMYAYLNTSTFTLVGLFGRTNEDPPRDVPIDAAWLRGTISQIMRRPDADARLREAVIAYSHTYGWGRHAPLGTMFVSYGVYEQVWTLSPDADLGRPPDTSELLVEVRRGAINATTSPMILAATTPGEATGDSAP